MDLILSQANRAAGAGVGWDLLSILIAVVVIAACIAIVWIGIRAMGLSIPYWAVQIFWVVVIAFVVIVALKVVLSMFLA